MQKGYSEDVSISVVKHLIDTGYIDDMRASRKVLAARSGKKQESRQYIFQRLLEAGIDYKIGIMVTNASKTYQDVSWSEKSIRL